MEKALNIVLRQLHVSGAVVLNQWHPVPWAIEVPDSSTLNQQMNVGSEVSVVPFHIAHRGEFSFQSVQGTTELVRENEMVICANGSGHIISHGDYLNTDTFEDVMNTDSFSENSSKGEVTNVICGVFTLRNANLNPLVSALPNQLVVNLDGENSSPALTHLLALLRAELSLARSAKSYMLERVLELLYAESVRVYAETAGDLAPSWLAAIKDQRIASALSFIHSNLNEELNIDRIAETASLSSSRFSSTFRDLMGIAPMTYITRQRLEHAATLLLNSELSVQATAFKSGYKSVPSFNKAFIKQFGSSPSEWRRAHKV